MKQKIIVITGVTKGLGRAWCEEFLRQGHLVYGCARNRKEIEKLAATHSGNGYFRTVDVLDAGQVMCWKDEIVQRHSCPDIVINNAAAIHARHVFEDIPIEEFNRVIDVNVKGLANCVRAFLPVLKKHNRGVMVNMSSGWGRFGDARASCYCASKFAVEGLTESISKELPEGVTVVTLCPGGRDGGVGTDMSVDYWGEQKGEDLASWAPRAARFVLSLNRSNNGAKLTVPLD